MRFILKSAFWLGLIAFLIPFGGEQKTTSANITVVGAFLGAQQAIADLTGFCGRAPQACDTGRELAVFAGERIGDGVQMAYGLVENRIDERKAERIPPTGIATARPAASPAAASTDPILTGAVAADTAAPVRLPMAYTPPKHRAEADEPDMVDPTPLRADRPQHGPVSALPPAPAFPAIPTPAPRA